MRITLSEISSPNPIGKSIKLSPEGKISITASDSDVAGATVRTKTFNPEELTQYLTDLNHKPNVALTLGVTPYEEASLTYSGREDIEQKRISRTLKFFSSVNSGNVGLCLLDMDSGLSEEAVDTYLGLISSLLSPAILNGSQLMAFKKKSSSSAVVNPETGEPLKNGWHCFVPVKGPTADFIKALFRWTWLMDPHEDLSKNTGQPLQHTLIDSSVGSPERLIFEADPTLPPILDGKVAILTRECAYTPGGILDTELALQILRPLVADFDSAWLQHKQRLQATPESLKLQKAYNEKRREQLKDLSPAAFAAVTKARNSGVLLSSDVLTLNDNKVIKVYDVLRKPEDYIEPGTTMSKPMRDPTDPEYGPSKARLLFFADHDNPNLYRVMVKSFAHGDNYYTCKFDAQGLTDLIASLSEDESADLGFYFSQAEYSEVQFEKVLEVVSKKFGSTKTAWKKDIGSYEPPPPPQPAQSDTGLTQSARQVPVLDKDATHDAIATAVMLSLGSKDDYRFFAGNLYLFDVHTWIPLKKPLLLKKIAVDYAHCSRCCTQPHYEQITKQIFATPDETQVLQFWPSVKGFACADGFYEITKEGKVIKKQPLKEHYIRTPLKFSPDADCPTPYYNKLLKSVINPECLEQLMGLILSNYLNKLQEVGTLFGVGGTGKGTITRILTAMLPPDRITNLDFAQLMVQEKLFALADSVLNVVNEVTAKPATSTAVSLTGATRTTSNYSLNTVGLKRATGGDLLQGRNLHRDHFTFYNPASFLMVFNTFPALDSTREDLFRRLSNFIVEFVKPQDFVKDVNLEDHIKNNELPGVLHRWIEATRRFLTNGYDNAHSLVLYDRWLRSFDSVSGFISEACVITGRISDAVVKTELHRHYIDYCKIRSYAPVDYSGFFSEVGTITGTKTEDELGAPVKVRGTAAIGGLKLGRF